MRGFVIRMRKFKFKDENLSFLLSCTGLTRYYIVFNHFHNLSHLSCTVTPLKPRERLRVEESWTPVICLMTGQSKLSSFLPLQKNISYMEINLFFFYVNLE